MSYVIFGSTVAVIGILVAVPIIRLVYVRSRIASFRAVVRAPGKTDWKRGYACYGQQYLVWHPLIQLGRRGRLHFPRETVQIAGVRHDGEEDTTFLSIMFAGAEYQLVLSTGDYNGLVCWVESAPPRSRITI